MALHVISGTSSAARLDPLLDVDDEILLLENGRVWTQDGQSNLDPVAYTRHLGRIAVCGRLGRDPKHHKDLKEVESIRRGDPVIIWAAKSLDDSLLSLWLFSCLDRLGYSPESIGMNQIFCRDGPISSVEQLSDSAFAEVLHHPKWMSAEEAALFRDRWALINSGDPDEFERFFAFDYSLLKGWQDVLATVLRRLPSDYCGNVPEAVVLLECLKLADWKESAAMVQYFTHCPFEPSKLRLPDANGLAAVLRREAANLDYCVDSMTSVIAVFQAASEGLNRFCVPFFWKQSLQKTLPPGMGARLLS